VHLVKSIKVSYINTFYNPYLPMSLGQNVKTSDDVAIKLVSDQPRSMNLNFLFTVIGACKDEVSSTSLRN
jgi:hypothetical protein